MISVVLLLLAVLLWYFAPPSPEPKSEIEALRVGAHETWLIAAGISLMLSLSLALAGLKLWLRGRGNSGASTSIVG
jgi:hypothetical protein